MIYQNFAASMTARYAVVCDNWPLERFCSPSSLGSRNEVKVLYQAFETNTARFRKLTEEEFTQWEEDTFNNALAITTGHLDNDSDPQPSPHTTTPQRTGSIEPQASPQQAQDLVISQPQQHQGSLPPAGPLQTNFVNTISLSDGTGLQGPTRRRKPRKDKGIPRKKKSSTTD